jgi:hypothetical protein
MDVFVQGKGDWGRKGQEKEEYATNERWWYKDLTIFLL